ncbi:hypothetical protein FPV67DRAFT_222637 [Lyophyllum atratum]|nr:hypothetical protein FPV67DRAFT_222637 [Lyophyllum atratum]
MRIGPSDGVYVSNSNTGFELYLTRSVNYGVLLYNDEPENRERLLVPGASKDDALRIAQGCLFLVEDKRLKCSPLSSHIPEAVSQAIALLKAIPNVDEVRFCLSDGETWVFFVQKEEAGRHFVYYESRPFLLRETLLETSVKELKTIISLVTEWLNVSPTPGLYQLHQLD